MYKTIIVLTLILLGNQKVSGQQPVDTDLKDTNLQNIYPYWPHKNFEWYYSAANEPNWLEKEQGLELFKNASEAWESCGPKLMFKGILATKGTSGDKINVFGWGELNPSIRALTYRAMRKNSSVIFESDIEVNSRNVDIKSNPILLQKVITHEFGHALGLLHSETCDNIMSSASECGKKIANPPPINPTQDDWAQCNIRYH
jgi:hypothetical protein